MSSDGKWRSFPKIPHLLQYVGSGTFYGRTKVDGKLIRQSLETDVWTTAKLKLVDFLKKHQEARTTIRAALFTEAIKLYERALDQNTRLKPQSKQYRRWCIRRIELSWPRLWGMRIDEITAGECRDWAARLNEEIACHYYNNTVGTLRQILDCGIRDFADRTNTKLENPLVAIPRARINQKELRLPEPDQFRLLVENVRNAIRQRARLSASCARQHQKRSVDLFNSLALFGIETCEINHCVTHAYLHVFLNMAD